VTRKPNQARALRGALARRRATVSLTGSAPILSRRRRTDTVNPEGPYSIAAPIL